MGFPGPQVEGNLWSGLGLSAALFHLDPLELGGPLRDQRAVVDGFQLTFAGLGGLPRAKPLPLRHYGLRVADCADGACVAHHTGAEDALLHCLYITEARSIVPPLDKGWADLTVPSALREHVTAMNLPALSP